MSHATAFWSIWLDLLGPFAWAHFTRKGYRRFVEWVTALPAPSPWPHSPRRASRRFVEWVTALALNVEEHTITQSVVAIERTADWKALESFAEYGRWESWAVAATLTRLIEAAPGRAW